MKSQTRPCIREDFESMLEMAKQMHQESPVYKDLPLDLNKLLELGEMSLLYPDSITLLVSETDGVLTGMLGAVATQEYFGPAITTCDLFLYVRPDKRGSLASFRLIKKYVKWAESLHATRISLGITTGILLEETGKLFEAAGFSPAGHLFTRINPNGHHQTQK